jgi:hypothetical protein
MDLLTQNGKMQKSSKNETTVVNWTIPAFQSATGLKTCPNAGLCAAGCYARQGAYMFGNVKRAHEAKLALTQNEAFVGMIVADIEKWLKKRSVKNLKVRIHDAGDFYDVSYWNKWREVMLLFQFEKRVSFYAYTKQVEMFQNETAAGRVPANFTLIYSFGGRQDRLIDMSRDRHSRVFETRAALKAAGYIDASHDDMLALGKNPKVGLCYHGTKSYSNTQWSKVSQNKKVA